MKLLRTLLLALGLGAAAEAGAATAAEPFWTPQAQQRLLEGRDVNDATSSKRLALARDGESRLREGDVAAADARWEALALQLHSPDVELAMVRSAMQRGDYRHALSFGAHTAGAHLEVTAGTALYCWLLHLGGHTAVAQRTLEHALAQEPDDADLLAVRSMMQADWPVLPQHLLAAPKRFAPYAWSAPTRSDPDALANAQVVGTATLAPDGRQAYVPRVLLGPARRLGLRNGLGQSVGASVIDDGQAAPYKDIARVRLDEPLPVGAGVEVVPREPYAGGVAYMAEFGTDTRGLPAWPVLRTGFFGRQMLKADERILGVEAPPGPRGGPVFDASGHWAGMASAGAKGQDRMVSAQALGWGPKPEIALGGLPPAPALGPDAIYEQSLLLTLQVLLAPE